MARKRKCSSVASTPQQYIKRKKAEIKESLNDNDDGDQYEDHNNNTTSTRKSNRPKNNAKVAKAKNDDEISNENNTSSSPKQQTVELANKRSSRKREVQCQVENGVADSKKVKQEESVKKSKIVKNAKNKSIKKLNDSESVDDESVDDESKNELIQKKSINNQNENQKSIKPTVEQPTKSALVNGKLDNDDKLNLSEDDESSSSDDEQIDESIANSKKVTATKTKTQTKNGLIDNANKSNGNKQTATLSNKKNSTTTKVKQQDLSSSDEEDANKSDDDNVDNSLDLNGVRRSGRKRTSRFSFKELVSSSGEDEDEEDEFVGRKSRTDKKAANKKVSKKVMKQTMKQFLGGSSSDEDVYKPDESEQSEDEEIVDADEEESLASDNESNISDLLPNTSNHKKSKHHFNHNNNQKKGGKQQTTKRLTAVKIERNNTSIDLSKYSVPKSGGCTFNSIGIETLGDPQSNLLKQKIANFKVPGDLTQTVSSAQSVQQAPSAFGNGSCVRKLLQESHFTKAYEKFKRGYIEKETTDQPIKKEDLMNILTEFETNSANPSSLLSSSSPSPTSSTDKQDSKTTKTNNDDESDDDTDDDDFEEVENAIVGEDYDDNYRPSCLKDGVTIEVKPIIPQRVKNKNEDWIYDAIRQGINRQRREIYLNATKVELLCYLARVKYLNEITFDQEMQAFALSIDFVTSLQKTSQINEVFVKKFVDKYKTIFKFNYCKDKSQLISSRDAIRELFETKETNHPTVYNLVLLILFRLYCKLNSLKVNSRLCIAVKPIDFKCDITISKPKKAGAVVKKKSSTTVDNDDFIDGDDDDDDEQDEKSTSKSKSKKGKTTTTAKAKKTKKNVGKKSKKKNDDESDEDNDDDDEDYNESKSTKRKSTKSKSSTKSTATKSTTNASKKAAKTIDENNDELDDKANCTKISHHLNKKNLIECWIEIFVFGSKTEWNIVKKKSGNKQPEKNLKSSIVNEWYCVEPINSIYTFAPSDLEKKFYVSPLYVLSFDNDGHLKDLTPKYVTNYYLHKFKRLRLEDDWLNETYSPYRPIEQTPEDIEEDEKIKQFYLSKPLPRSQAEFKNHGLYVLEKHLLKYEVIWPQDAPLIGKFGQDNIYLRENVHETHSKEFWKKEGRQLKNDEEPMKVTTARPKWDKSAGDWIRNLPLELYHYSQTQEWDAGEVVDGKVPRNEYGNIDLFKPTMLPKGASYLRLNGLLKIAQKLNIDCVPAVTGFDLKCGGTVPLMDGFVVPSEYEEILTIAWNEEQERIFQNAQDKYYKRVYGNWRRLIKGCMIHLEIRRKYRGDDDDE